MGYLAAIVGCGEIAGGYDERAQEPGIWTHAGAYRACERTSLIAAADVNKKRLVEFGRRWGITNLYTHYRELLQAHQVDVLSICTPDDTHAEIVQAALDLNPPRALFCEKPFASTVQEAEGLLLQCQSKGVLSFVNYQRRWEALHQHIRSHIASGGLGAMEAVRGYYVGGLLHNGCTVINTFRFLLSAEVAAVQALASGKNDLDRLDFALFFHGGAAAIVQACDKHGKNYSIFEIDLVGERGRAHLLDNGHRLDFFTVGDYSRYSGLQRLVRASLPGAASNLSTVMKIAVDQIVQALEGAKTANWAEETIPDLKVIERVRASAKRGCVRLAL